MEAKKGEGRKGYGRGALFTFLATPLELAVAVHDLLDPMYVG